MKTSKRNLLLLAVIAVAAALGFYLMPRDGQGSGRKKVLVVLPLTGATSSWGEHFKRGVDAFHWNREAHLDVEVIDSQSNPTATLSAVQQACLKARPYAIVSTMSSTTVALSEWTKKEGIFLVACIISDKVLANPVHVQRVYPSVQSNAGPLAEYANTHFKRAAIIYSNEDLGLAVKNEFTKRYTGGEVVFADGYALKDADVRSLVTKAMETKPDAILVTGVGTSFWAVVRELRTQSYQGQILSDASFADPNQIGQLGSAADGIIYMGSETELSEPRTEAARAFNKRFVETFGVPVNYTGVTVHESLRILDSFVSKGITLDGKAFADLGSWEGTPGTIRFIQGADSLYPWFLIIRESGKSLPVSP